MSLVRRLIGRSITNIHGWATNRRIVVIESDDWGSIRMPSAEVYRACLKAGYRVDLNPFDKYDSLASKDDIEVLFQTLLSYKDRNGKFPVITANCVVANPYFDKIKLDGFSHYHNELITETFKSYPRHTDNFNLWKEGNNLGIFHPQFHGREHLNVSKFMHALKKNDPDALFAFSNNMPGIGRKGNSYPANYFIEATNYSSEEDKTEKLSYYLKGLEIFEKLFGYKSVSIAPPNYTWSNDFNEPVVAKGVQFIQGLRKMKEPRFGCEPVYHPRKQGLTNSSGLTDLVRNCTFEPTLYPYSDSVDGCLLDISNAFKFNKPAIICSHRINYVGYINLSNRDRTIKLLNNLLSRALLRWPDIEFYTSEDLGNSIRHETH